MDYELVLKLINEHKKEMDNLKNKIIDLEFYIERLAFCKISNPKYPYYEFIVMNRITPEQDHQITRLFSLLSRKFNNEAIDNKFMVDNYPTDFLFSHEEIKFIDVSRAIREIVFSDITHGVGEDDYYSFSLIKAMFEQGKHVELCGYLMSKAGFKNEWN